MCRRPISSLAQPYSQHLIDGRFKMLRVLNMKVPSALSRSSNLFRCADDADGVKYVTLAHLSALVKSGRIKAAAIVTLTFASMFMVLGAASYCIASYADPATLFLDPFRAPTAHEAEMICPIRYAMLSRETNDVIFVGDSTCLHGIDTKAFERISGLRAYNLATIGAAGPSTALIILKAYLASHSAPKAICLVLSPIAFEEIKDLDGDLAGRFAASFGDSPSPMTRVRLGSLLLGAAFRRDGGDVRTVPLDGFYTETLESLQQKIADNRGYWQLPRAEGPRFTVAQWQGQSIEISQAWESALEEIADMSPGTKLIIRTSPVRNDMGTARDFVDFERQLRGLQARHVSWSVCDSKTLWYEPSLCWDQVHLNRDGTATFMPIVAKDVQTVLAN
jgi:hypothetical protein